MRHQLDQASVDQDTRTDGVEDTVHDECGLRLGRKRGPDTEANRNGNGRRDTVSETQKVRCPALAPWPWDLGETGAQTEAFKRLVEDEDNVERGELFAGDGEGQSDEDGMEDDAELEDENGGELSGVRLRDEALRLPVWAECRVVRVVALVAEVVLAAHMGGPRWCFVLGSALVLETVLVVVAVGVAMTMVVVMIASKFGVAHGHQLKEKHDKGSHESDRLGPWVSVGGDGLAYETLVAESLICRGEQMDERCCNDNAGTKVLGHEECPCRYQLGPRAFRKGWEYSAFDVLAHDT